MTAADAEHRPEIAANLKSLLDDIGRLDVEIRERLEPHRGGRFWVFHPAWGYFADDYGLRQVAIEREGKEPTPQELGELIHDARAEGVRTIFVQPQFSEASAEIVAHEIGAQLVTLDPLAADWPASLREAGERLSAALAEQER
jgi:zinc transport system substrate-binding protein